MRKETLMDAINHLDLDLIENYCKEAKRAGKAKKTYWNWKKCSVAAVIVCLLISSMFCIRFIKEAPTQTQEFSLPVEEEYIAWLSEDKKYESFYAEDESVMDSITKWNDLNVSENLYDTLTEAKDETYLAIIVRNEDDSMLNQFVFQGKTYEEYQRKYEELEELYFKLESLKKEGAELKYGRKLYEEGGPDGVKWSKELYNQRLSYYGEEFINQYICNGEFYSEDVEKDMIITEATLATQSQLREEAREAYENDKAEQMYQIFKDSNCCVTCKNGNLYLFITKKELSKLNIEKTDNYVFYAASLSGYKGTISMDRLENATDDTDSEIEVNLSKLYFETLDGENFIIKNDEDVVEALKRSIDTWKYTYDSLEFIFYIQPEEIVNEDWFDEMNYVEIQQWNYPTRIVVDVLYENINVEALKELSLRKEISSIAITIPIPEADVDPTVP